MVKQFLTEVAGQESDFERLRREEREPRSRLKARAVPFRASDRITRDEALAFIGKWLRFPVQEMTVALMQEAFTASMRWGLAYWDAAVIEAARLRCGLPPPRSIPASRRISGPGADVEVLR